MRLDDAVAVVADHMGAAKKGLEALSITWDEGANATLATADLVSQLEQAAKQQGVVARQQGNVAAATSAAVKTVDAVYHMPLLAHATMEPLNCTVHVRADGCEVWTSSQVLSRARATAAEVTGLPLDKVVVHNQFLGGGFGRRLEVDYVTQAVRIARQVDGPVKVIWTREEDIQHDIFRPIYLDQLTAGLDAAGNPVSFQHRVVGSSIIARWVPQFFENGLDIDAVDGAAGPYDFANLHGRLRARGAARRPDHRLVARRRRHPQRVRGRGLRRRARGHRRQGPGRVSPRACWQRRRARWPCSISPPRRRAGASRSPAGKGRGVSVIVGFGSYVAQVAEVAVAEDGSVRVERVVCAVDCGTVVNPDTVTAQMQGGIMYGLTAALYGEITLKDGRVEQGNFDTYQILRIDEAPKVEVHIVPSDAAPGGIGEPGTATIAPAVVNAVFAATGKRLRKLPIDTGQLKSA